MRIEKTFVGDVAILELKGEFDTFDCARFSEEVDSLVTLGLVRVILDFRFLRFINSTALGAVLKARKALTTKGGELVISQPAKIVAEALDTLGFSDIMPVFTAQEDALAHFEAAEKKTVPVGGDNVLLFQFKNAEHAAAFGRTFAVARLEEIEEETLRFKFERGGEKGEGSGLDPKVHFAPGNELQLKFRLPLYRKAYYFECTGRITRTQIAKSAVRVTVEFEGLSPDDKKSIHQFVQDMRFLKEEIRGSQGD